jgi:Ca2+/H+ antiporter
MEKRDAESQTPTQLSHFAQVLSQAGITQDVEAAEYKGSGTEEDPYIVDWITQDPRNPMLYSKTKRWSITAVVAIATLAVALVSSAYSGGAKEVIAELGCSEEVFTLGIGESCEEVLFVI